jgi:hypothetical protein
MYVRDELAGWIAQLDKRARSSNLCLSVFGGIQPARLQAYVADAATGGAGDDGFLFQLLLWPDVAWDWDEIDRPPACANLEAHAQRVYGSVASLPQRLAAASSPAGSWASASACGTCTCTDGWG